MREDDEAPVDEVRHWREKLVEAEDELASIALRVQFSRSVVELNQLPIWQKLGEIIAKSEQTYLEHLRTHELAPYHLGKKQGMLHVLRFVTSAKPLSPEDLASIEKRVTVLRTQVQEYRDLIQ